MQNVPKIICESTKNAQYILKKELLSLIPGLEGVNILRYGVMHRNTFINSPKVLNNCYQMINNPNIYFAGQITGVEGYVESISSGLVAGIDLAKRLLNEERIIYSEDTIIGSLANYISSEHDDFQPMNANFGLLKPLSNKIRDKKLRYQKLAERALKSI